MNLWLQVLTLFDVIKKSITSGRQREENKQNSLKYEDTKKINFTAIISNKLSSLAMSDSDFIIAEDNKRAEQLNLIASSVLNKSKKIVSTSLGTGGALLVPYVQNGKIFFNIASQDRLCINNMSGDTIIGATVLADTVVVDNIRYYRFTNYTVENNILTVTNKVTTEFGRPAEVEQWNAIRDISITNVDRVPFGFIKSPIDNRKCSDEYGVPVTYGCDEIIRDIYECLDQIREEFELKRVRLGVDNRAFDKDKSGKPTIKDKVFLLMHNFSNEKMFDIFDPALRDSSYYNRLTNLFALLEKSIGTSRGILTEPESTYENSQKIREAVGDTFAIISDIRKAVEKGLTDFFYACDILANYYNLSPAGEYEITYNWSYSLIESTTETWQQMTELHSRGLITDERLNMWVTGQDEEQATDEIAKAKKSQKDSINAVFEE